MNIPNIQEKKEELAEIAEVYGVLVAFDTAIEFGFKTGVEASKGCVPEKRKTDYTNTDGKEWNECRDATLKNMESLITSE